jgi:hypothetical protein
LRVIQLQPTHKDSFLNVVNYERFLLSYDDQKIKFLLKEKIIWGKKKGRGYGFSGRIREKVEPWPKVL